MDQFDFTMAEKVIEALSHHKRDSVTIKIDTEKKPDITDSKFGGMPYIPRNVGEPPKNFRDQTLFLLAQFNFAQLPAGAFPSDTGILQFFIDFNDDLYGCDMDNWTNTASFKAIYHPEIEEHLTREEITAIYDKADKEYGPIDDGEWGLSFEPISKENLTTGDYRFDEAFVEEWNKLYPDQEIDSLFDDQLDDISDELYENYNGDGHKLLGYPYFTQSDPREYNDSEYELLFQMDSDWGSDVPYEILWGDAGVGNFFIKPEDLAKLDFSNVAYNWDCG